MLGLVKTFPAWYADQSYHVTMTDTALSGHTKLQKTITLL